MIKLMDLHILLWDFAPVSEENLFTGQPVLFLSYIHGLKIVCMCFKAQFLNVEKNQIFLAILILHRWLTRIPLAELVWLNWIFRKRNHTHTALLAISTWNKEWISMTKTGIQQMTSVNTIKKSQFATVTSLHMWLLTSDAWRQLLNGTKHANLWKYGDDGG